ARSSSTASKSSAANRCSPRTRSTSARACRSRTSSRSTAGRSRRCSPCAASRALAGEPSWPMGTCVFSARCCSAARPASRPNRPRSSRGAPFAVRRRALALRELELRPRLDGDRADADGLLSASVLLAPIDGREIEAVELELDGPSGAVRTPLALSDEDGLVRADGTARVPSVARWWPHTHGEPTLHELSLRIATSAGAVTVDAGCIGFRTLAPGAAVAHDAEADGLDLHVNGVRVFARGAVWTPSDIVSLAGEEATLRATLELARDAGMNMLRIPGTGAYEGASFHDLCDELGLLVWQDFMFANLDYPIADEDFRETVEREASAVLADLSGRASLAVLCGNSEIEQQVAMLGLDPALGRGELFGELLPGLVAGRYRRRVPALGAVRRHAAVPARSRR